MRVAAIELRPQLISEFLMQRLRVNVGCGATPTPGWVNLDNSWTIRGVRNAWLRPIFRATGLLRGKDDYVAAIHRHDVRWADASRYLPLESASADVIYTSHMLEHMTREECARFYAEALRALAPGGILRVAVPDIDYHVEGYARHGDPDAFIAGLCMAGEPPRGFVAKLKHAVVGERHHLWMYNGASMSAALLKAGFAKATVMPAGETSIADPGALDLAERAPESVFVEAVKA